MSVDCDALQSCPVFQEDDGIHADDATWVLTSSFVILTMQSGFGLLEMGASIPGNEVNIMLKNVFDVVFGALAYFFIGYGISYGSPSIPFMGLGDFLPDDGKNPDQYGIEHALLYSRYIFQFSFAATSTTIVSGCIAMRMRFFVYCAYSFYAVIVYSFVAHWVWAYDGWLAQLGVHDFAGAGPVHLLGATNGLVAVLMLGPRTGRFDGTRPKSDFNPSSPTSMLFGLFMLWWGWIGFNCGSSFGITDQKWMVATRAAVTTINSTAGGGVAALLYTQVKTRGKFVRPGDIVTGILGSLVAITATCAAVRPFEALFIGLIGSIVAVVANDIIEFKLKLDDPVGAIGVHGAAAIFGILAVGFFADGDLPGVEVDDGLFRGGGWRLLGVQCLEIVTIIVWSFICTTPFFYLVGILISRQWRDPRKGLRVPIDEELGGADLYLHDCGNESSRRIESFLEKSGYVKQVASRQLHVYPSDSEQGDKSSEVPESEDAEGYSSHSVVVEVSPRVQDRESKARSAGKVEVSPRAQFRETRSHPKKPTTLPWGMKAKPRYKRRRDNCNPPF